MQWNEFGNVKDSKEEKYYGKSRQLCIVHGKNRK